MLLDKFLSAKSVVFITLHKCASLFFSRWVLSRLRDHKQIDYQWLHYENRLEDQVAVRKRSHVYGPVRILDSQHPSYGITEEILSQCVRKGLKTIFFVRDPRDILVSMYYSFGFSHPQSPHPDIMDYQRRRRQRIQAGDLDEFALDGASALAEKFARIGELSRQVNDKIFLRYEDMIGNFEGFYLRLNGFVRVAAGFKDEMCRLTRPEKEENLFQHKRLAKIGNFRDKLNHETIAELNKVYASILQEFLY